MIPRLLVVIPGPTAVGKTETCIEIAAHFNAEIFSADSRQFYRELKTGTAVPADNQLKAVKHHFIHTRSVADYYNAWQYELDAIRELDNYFIGHSIAILTGGSGMYIDAVCNGIDLIPDVDPEIREALNARLRIEGIESLRFELKRLDPEYYSQVDLKNSQRILRALEVCIQTGKAFSSFRTKGKKVRNFSILKIGLNREREELYRRIDLRVDEMFVNGLEKEAHSALKFREYYALKTVGYRELFDYFDGKINLPAAKELIKRNTRHFARRQMTWFRKDNSIAWYHPED
ncbi:MAG: tRNA (adenosine(37)-N6)-dimethylallyltransferase MiaA, partial [Bacteroidota bacterium]